MATIRTYLARLARAAVIALALLVLVARIASAAGTAAGTDITNQATVSCMIGASPYTAASTVNVIRVQELIDVTVTWQDAAAVTVIAGQTDRVTTYRITNSGNGNDAYTLAATGAGVGGDDFDPAVTSIYIDSNGNSTYDPGIDTPYGADTGPLAGDASLIVFVLSTIPAAGLNPGDRGDIRLSATSVTGTGVPGTIVAGAGESGTDAMIGMSQGAGTATGSYQVTDLAVVMNKTASVTDQYGGSLVMTGSMIRYTITVTVTGSGTANNVMIEDPIPANTTYTAGSLLLNGTGLTDAVDIDAGDVGGTTVNTVTVALGGLTSASPAQVIVFEVTID